MAAVFLLFLLSGMTALIFEAVFLRQLTWLLGSAVTATAVVLAIFMGGLALGAALIGPRADLTRRPLRLYGMVEIGAALSGALSVWCLGSQKGACLALVSAAGAGAGARLAGYALALAALIVPTLLMGATLPILGRYVISSRDRIAGRFGALYAVNTLGGAAGVLLAGFVLFEHAGISGTGYIATLLGCGVGLAALALDAMKREVTGGMRSSVTPPRDVAGTAPTDLEGEGPARTAASGPARPRAPVGPRKEPGSSRASAKTHAGAARSLDITEHPGLRAAVYAAIAVSGAAMLGYEVLWTRLLALPMRSFSYSFSMMLCLFLTGLVLGGALASGIGGRVKDPIAFLGWILVVCGAYVAASVVWLPGRLGAPVEASGLLSFFTRSARVALPVILPPTMLSGLALPFAVRALVRDEARLGGDMGRVYAVNTLGAIGGTLVTWLVLLPAIGVSRSLAALAALNAAAGAIVLVVRYRPSAPSAGPSRAWAVRAAAVAVVGACALATLWPADGFVSAFLSSSRGKEKIAELLFYHEGASDTVAIVRKDYGFLDVDAKSLITNGVAMSATARPVRRYMAAEGHLPVLMTPAPRRALVLCLGTGITLGAVASHPEVVSIDGVDLSEGVMRGLPYFAGENDSAYLDPRVRLVREDGRHFLETGRQTYDLITLEPPPPVVAGSSHLYSLDFYASCARHMSEGAVIAQWLPLHAQSRQSARMTARTFCRAFPHVQLWLPSVRDAVLIGSNRPLVLTLERLQTAYGTPSIRKNLAASYLETPQALLGTYLMDRSALEAWAGDGPSITDEHPWMEFLPLKGPNMTDREIASLMNQPQGSRDWVAGLAREPGLAERIETENRALRLHVRSKTDGNDVLGAQAARLSTGTEFFLSTIGCAGAQLDALWADPRSAMMAAAQARACATVADPLTAPRGE